MKFTPSKINIFLMAKIPSAYISGVRVRSLTSDEAVATVKYKWINQNPFKSMYWVTQGMASELTTGILVMKQIAESGKKISMLVTNQNGTFTKKARGKITFTCKDGDKIKQAIKNTLESGEGQVLTLTSEGYDESGDKVSKFEYEWSIKAKK
ncbi:DUF4442 domain-containing protein [Urechidicola croceus]|uniref:Thioesterase n=1 Tax=Urechidicola croceus TaxID=1850246 RepID=A0A1D8PB94_9FLAO|nr:DUF4442 domain-containing protein [Urechidicola croceus]AOW21838.1 thioesterase [Urechidicola croceus]